MYYDPPHLIPMKFGDPPYKRVSEFGVRPPPPVVNLKLQIYVDLQHVICHGQPAHLYVMHPTNMMAVLD